MYIPLTRHLQENKKKRYFFNLENGILLHQEAMYFCLVVIYPCNKDIQRISDIWLQIYSNKSFQLLPRSF